MKEINKKNKTKSPAKISVQQKAVDFASDRKKGAGHGYPSFTAQCIEKGYLAGYKQALLDKKREFKSLNIK